MIAGLVEKTWSEIFACKSCRSWQGKFGFNLPLQVVAPIGTIQLGIFRRRRLSFFCAFNGRMWCFSSHKIQLLEKNFTKMYFTSKKCLCYNFINQKKEFFMARKRQFLLSIVLLVAVLATVGIVANLPIEKASAESVSFYDESAAPIFYGATKITITKDAVDQFDIKDSRFRIFAKDYEDGDVTPDIVCVSNNVNPKVAGEYQVSYSVTDSHRNTATITVPVTVLDEVGGKFVVQRTVYAVPKMENLSMTGTERCNTGDRQILGIFVPQNAFFQARTLSSGVENNFEITFFTNNRMQNSFQSIHKSSSDYQKIANFKNNTYLAGAVPLITSPRLSKEKVDVTYTIELSYDKSVQPLDYYHYKDNQQEFVDAWTNSGNAFGVVDGEAMLVVVPFDDRDKLSNYRAAGYNAPFGSLDEFFEYYRTVLNRMDEGIGLSFDPTNALDRNYRIKYTCVADAGQPVAAYYGGGFIGIGSTTAAPFFQYGWGTLHEIAHGYQGFLGRGNTKGMNLGLNETGNNVLAYYIQNDRELYKGTDDWLGGSLAQVEEGKNALRLSGAEVFVATATYVNVYEKLYALVNLYDTFEGATTYGKLFSYYRALSAEQGVNAYTVPDIYAKFFAKEYSANIIPYLKAWKLTISDEVDNEVSSKKLTTYVIPSDLVGLDRAKALKESGTIDLLYAPVSEKQLELADKVNLTINLNIDNFDIIKGRNLGIYKGEELVQLLPITAPNMVVEGLKIGTYRLALPQTINYNSPSPSLTLTSQEATNTVTIDYRNNDTSSKIFHPTQLRMLGVTGTVGFSMTFADDNKSGKIYLGASNLGNQNELWKNKPDEVYASVTIQDQNGGMVEEYVVKGNGYFSLKGETKDVTLQYGYKIVVYTQRPNSVGVLSMLTNPNKELPEYQTSTKSTTYIVTQNGLQKDGADVDTENILYNAIKDEWIGKIDAYSKTLTDEQAKNLRYDTAAKGDILKIYNSLKDEDRAAFREFCDKLAKGNAPVINTSATKVSIWVGDNIDLRELIKITDIEDIRIDSYSSKVTVSQLDTTKAGTYNVQYTVTDFDGNVSIATVQVEVKEKPTTDSGDKPSGGDQPSGGNTPDNGDKPSGSDKPSANAPDIDSSMTLGGGSPVGIIVAVVGVLAIIAVIVIIVLVNKKKRQ